jgi:TFIIF-interacting CTD phosphatase-like protein
MKLLTTTINKEANQEDKTIKNILEAAKSRFFLKREHLTFTESFQAIQDYQYTLALDLDETLIHFVSNEKKFKLRPSCLLFLYEMANLFEVVIFTAAAKDYADYILNILERRLVARYGPL